MCIRDRYGTIKKDEVWSGEVHVIGDIEVLPEVTLTILPGTKIYVSAHKDRNNLKNDNPEDFRTGKSDYGWDEEKMEMHFGEPYKDELNHVSLLIQGTLIAKGTEDEKILITSDAKKPSIYDWNYFNVNHGELSYVNLEYCRVFGLQREVEVTNCTIKNIGECIAINGNEVRFMHNKVSDCGFELISINHSNPIIKYNRLGPNRKKYDYQQSASIFVHGGRPVIENNIFYESSDPGITFCNTDKEFKGSFTKNTIKEGCNIFLQCEEDKNLEFYLKIPENNIYSAIHIREGFKKVELDLSNCFWGTSDLNLIKSRIYGQNTRIHKIKL